MIEILEGSGYDHDGKLVILTKRLDREDFWINTLRTFCRYGVTERKRKSPNSETIGSLYFPIKTLGPKNYTCCNKRDHKQSTITDKNC